MENDKTIGACQPKILSYQNKKQFEYAGACGGWIDKHGYPFARGRVFDTCEFDEGQYNDVQQIFWATGAALFIRASVFNLLGGFDEYFFAHQEEIDLCWRMQLAGYKIFVHPASRVYHVGAGTLPEGRQKTFLNFRNNLVMLTKNLSANKAFLKISSRIFLDNVAAWHGLLSGNSSMFFGIYKAHLHYTKWLFTGKPHQKPEHQKMHPAGIYHGSIIWQYFIKKKKTFSEIVKRKSGF
jgi:GT2 family glycosyltransferase